MSRARKRRWGRSRKRATPTDDRAPSPSPSPSPSPADPAPLGPFAKRFARIDKRAAKAYARADHAIADADAAPPPSPRPSAVSPAKLAKLERAMARAVAPRKPGLLARFAAWRRRRRHRAWVAKLERSLARGELRVADLQSSALLAILTERIARLSSTDLSRRELDDTIAFAQRLADEYRTFVTRLAAALAATDPASKLHAKATAELARCEAGQRRINDALAQLHALARRLAPPG